MWLCSRAWPDEPGRWAFARARLGSTWTSTRSATTAPKSPSRSTTWPPDANADLTKADQANEVIAFADYWARVAGAEPGLLVFDSKVTTYKMLDALAARGITFLTLRQRGQKVLEALAALPSSAWSTYNLKRAGRYRHPQIHEEIIRLKGIEIALRQIAVHNIGHEHPTLLITNDLVTAAKDLFERYAERMVIENELDADISGFGLNALASGLPLNVDLDTTLTVLAGNAYRLLGPQAPPLRASHPRPALAPLPRQHRQDRRRRGPRPGRPRRSHLHPGAHRRRLPRARPTRPLVGRTHAPLRLPAPMNLNPTI